MDINRKQFSKRLAVLLLAVVMLLGVFPLTVFATEESEEMNVSEEWLPCEEEVPIEDTATFSEEEGQKDGGVGYIDPPKDNMALPTNDENDYLKLHKTVSYKGGTDYLLTLEAYLVGELREVKQPLDICLTIDLTGSMHQSMVAANSYVRMYNYSTTRDPDGSANPRAYVNYSAATGGPYAVLRKYSKDSNGKWTYKDTNMAPNNTYAVKSGNTWIPVTVKNGTWTDSSGKTYSAKTHPGSGGTQIYTKGKVTQMDAMVNAIVNFIEAIEADAKKNNLNHRIAMVSFQEFEFAGYPFFTGVWNGSTMYGYIGGTDDAGRKITKVTTTNYQNAFKSVNGNKASFFETLGTMMQAPYYSRGTFPLSGIQMTNNVFSNGSKNNNPKINVFFSDGEPNRGTDDNYYWDKDIYGRGSLEAIKTTKKTAQVFAVGIFSGANDQSLGAATPTTGASYANYFLQRISSNYSGSGNPDVKKGYYVAATDSDKLVTAFQKVLNRIVSSGGAKLELTGGSKLKDVISDNFKLPDNITTSDIKVYTADYTTSGSFAARQAFTGATVSIGADKKTIEVTNFNYGANWVGNVLDHTNTVIRVNGKKIIVEIPIVAVKQGNGLVTNATSSSVTEGSFTDSFAVPKADIPISVRFKKTAFNTTDKSRDFKIQVQYTTFMQSGSDVDYDYNNNNGSNGNHLSGKTRTETKEFTFNSATGITIPNLYYGSVLKFKELVDDAYQQVITYTTGDGTTGTLTPDADGYYSIPVNSDVNIDVQNINKRVVIPVGKNYVGLPGTGTAGTFRFKVEVQTEKGWVTLNTSAYPRLYADPTVTVAPGGSTSVDADIRFAPGDTTKKTLRFTEIKADGVLCDEAAFLVDVSFDANGEPKLLTHGTNNSFMVSTVRFENTQLLPLELKKVISGNAADPNRVFSFKVNVTLANGKPGNYIVADLLGDASEDNGTFYLTNNSVAKVMIPYGATVSVEEQNSDPYTTVITVNGKQEGNHNGSPTRKTNLKVTGTSNSIVYENRYQILIDTGVVLESLPYILILAAVAVGAILFLRKRKDQDD